MIGNEDETTSTSTIPEPIAIVGIGCRFPASDGPEGFWRVVRNGVDAIVDVPADRWSSSAFYHPDPAAPGKVFIRQGGFLRESLEAFDAAFFGMSPREAARLDPQQRLLLEVTWECFEDAGIPPERLAGTRSGVFVGGFMQDSVLNQLSDFNAREIGVHTGTGASMTMLSARLSYAFDLRGPCISVDTACSSSLVALHYGCRSLWNGECDHALVGGVNVMLRPEVVVSLCKGGFLSPDARCKAFDSRANGYARGEGAGVVLLKPLAAAIADGNHVYAVVLGTSVNQDGHSKGITVPAREAQEAVMRAAYDLSGCAPRAVQYVEAHGTGTRVGDPIEAQAIGAVIGAGRSGKDACIMASVKTNIGHLEAAAGIAAVIKTALAIEHREIPPHLHLKSVNPDIDLETLGLRIPAAVEPWPEGDVVRAAINSFGYGGTNAHAVLGAAPAASEVEAPRREHVVLPISGRSVGALRGTAQAFADLLRGPAAPSLHDVAYAASVGRSHHLHRAAFVSSSCDELAQQLGSFARGELAPGASRGEAREGAAPVFVFSGMGPQWWGMGHELFHAEAVFRRALEDCDALFRAQVGGSLIDEMLAQQSDSRIEGPILAQVANFALQVALVHLWKSWGVVPGAVVGHSAGEAAAAYAAGALSLEDAFAVSFHRARLQATTAGKGRLLAVELTVSDAQALIAGHEQHVCIGAVNGRTSLALSGDLAALETIAGTLETRGVFHRFVRGDVPYHSPAMQGLKEDLLASLRGLHPRGPSVPLYSAVTGKRVVTEALDASYWWHNVRDVVVFADATERLIDDGHSTFLEIGPHPTLSAVVASTLRDRAVEGTVVSSLRRQAPESATLLRAVGMLFVSGQRIAFDALNEPRGRFVRLPTYPWQRERHWQESAESRRHRLGAPLHPLLGRTVTAPTPTWDTEVSSFALPYLLDHKVEGEVVLPGAAYVEIGVAVHHAVFGDGSPATIDSLELHTPLVIDREHPPVLRIVFERDSRSYTVHSRIPENDASWMLHARGTFPEKAPATAAAVDLPELLAHDRWGDLDSGSLYARLGARALDYGPSFQGLTRVARGQSEMLCEVSVPGVIQGDAASYFVHPALLDACFQGMILAADDGGTDTYVPVRIEQVRYYAPVRGRIFCHGRIRSRTRKAVESDLLLVAESSRVLAELRGVRAQAIPRAAKSGAIDDSLYYRVAWQARSRSTDDTSQDQKDGCWLIFADDSGAWRELRDLAENRSSVLAFRGDAFEQVDERVFRIRAHSIEDYRELLQHISASGFAVDGVAFLWPLDAPSADLGATVDGMVATGTELVIEGTYLVQAVVGARLAATPRLVLVTRGAQQVQDDRTLAAPGPSTLWGFGRVVCNEYPDLKCTLVDLGTHASALAELRQELARADEEPEIALRERGRYVFRYVRVPPDAPERRRIVDTTTAGVHLPTPAQGGLDALSFRQQPRREPGLDEVEIRIEATSVHFKDVAKTMGLLADEFQEGTYSGGALGIDCAGTVVRIGGGVEHLRAGDEVVAILADCFASFVTVPTRYVVPKPKALSFEQGAASAFAFVVAQHALIEVARTRPGERVLVHSAAGGVGLATIQIARCAGALVVATAGTEEKREYLRSMGVEHVMDSRSLEFADEVKRAVGSHGIDVVINTLSGEGAERSAALLSAHGRFIDLIYRKESSRFSRILGLLPRNASLVSIDLDSMFAERDDKCERLLRAVVERLDRNELSPLPLQTFPSSEVSEAFRRVARGQAIGKVVVSCARQKLAVVPSSGGAGMVRSDAAYVVTGGCGGLGLAVAKWLSQRGARHLVLVGRRGAESRESRAVLEELTRDGVQVRVAAVDVTDRGQVASLLEDVRRTMPPLRGVMHSAAVFHDGFLAGLTREDITRSMAPKALGAWNFHLETLEAPLDWFVMFSSAARVMASAGLTAYASSNQFLSALARYRRGLGLPATSVDWGAVSDVGIAARDATVAKGLARMGFLGLAPQGVMRALGEILETAPVEVSVTSMDWPQWARGNLVAAASPRFAHIMEELSSSGLPGAPGAWDLASAHAANAEERAALVLPRVRELVARIVGTPAEQLALDQPLESFGLDSLMATELRSGLESYFGVTVPIMKLLQRATTVRSLSAATEGLLSDGQPAESTERPPADVESAECYLRACSFPAKDGLTIYGHLSVPTGAGPFPAIVVHTADRGGALDSSGEYWQIEEHAPLLAAGFAVLTVDQRGAPGHGDEYQRQAELGAGDIDDLIAAGEFLSTLTEIDHARMALLGVSRGAYACLLALTREPKMWRAAVLKMGFYDALAYARSEQEQRPNSSLLLEGGARAWNDVFEYFSAPVRNGVLQIEQTRKPLFVVHGDDDRLVPPEQATRLVEAATAAGIPVTLERVPGMEHDIRRRHPAWPDVWRKVTSFLGHHVATP
jgi:epothilone polyketide synthase D